jgi:hypothetical protein
MIFLSLTVICCPEVSIKFSAINRNETKLIDDFLKQLIYGFKNLRREVRRACPVAEKGASIMHSISVVDKYNQRRESKSKVYNS